MVEGATNLVQKWLSHWSIAERRRANQHKEGGMLPKKDALQELDRAGQQASRIAQALHRLLDCLVGRTAAALEPLEAAALDWLKRLLRSSFLVTQLSSQLLNTQKQFNVSLQLLVGNDLSNCSVQLNHYLVSESDLPALLANVDLLPSFQVAQLRQTLNVVGRPGRGRRPFRAAPHEHNDFSKWDLHFWCGKEDSAKGLAPTDGCKTANGSRKRRGRENPVTSLKKAVLFDLDLTFRGRLVRLRTHTMPLVLTSHAKQYCDSWCKWRPFFSNSF